MDFMNEDEYVSNTQIHSFNKLYI
jgi:hypothetical protein